MIAARAKVLLPFGLLLLLAFCMTPSACAQQSAPNILPPSAAPSAPGNLPPGSDPLMGGLNERMAIERNHQRQQKIVRQSAQLLALAQKLKADVDKSSPNQLSVAVVKEAAEIEKLAKSIKDHMRNGY